MGKARQKIGRKEGGKRAQKQGRLAENHCANMLADAGLVQVKLKNINPERAITCIFDAQRGNFLATLGVFARQVNIARSIHGGWVKEDFLMYKPEWPTPLAMAVRAQMSDGTTLEKLEYVCANINEKFPCPAFVLLDGPGIHDGARRRTEDWVHMSQGRVIGVFHSVEDLRRWLGDGAEYPQPQLGTKHKWA